MQKYHFKANHNVKHITKKRTLKCLTTDISEYPFPVIFQCFGSLSFRNNHESNRSSSHCNTELEQNRGGNISCSGGQVESDKNDVCF